MTGLTQAAGTLEIHFHDQAAIFPRAEAGDEG
jgi:hypothetical protein